MKKSLLYLLLIPLLWSACKDEEPPPEDQPENTAYNFAKPGGFPKPPFPENNPPTVEGVMLGRMLFYDPILSADSTQSCADCHNQELAFTDHGEALSTGIRGLKGKRNSMPIFNLVWNRRFFWDGRAFSLTHQALMPIQDPLEMDESLENVELKLNRSSLYKEQFRKAFGDEVISSQRVSQALEQFMNIIVSGNSRFDRHLRGEVELNESEKLGMQLFLAEFDPDKPENRGADCFHCHSNTLFSNFQFMNNGLDSVFTDLGLAEVSGRDADKGKFKVPSLRNVEVSGPYMHDGRFESLEEVVDFYNSGVQESSTLDPNMHAIKDGIGLTAIEKKALVDFMKTLTDQVYLTNPEYSNPFEK